MIERVQIAVGAIVRREDHLLLIRRGTPPQAGRWSLPGGRVEPGETLDAAVVREVQEETGLDVIVGELVGWVERISPDHHFVIMDFEATPTSTTEPVAGDDADEARWIKIDDIASLDLVDGMLTFLREHDVIS